jgi:hypothetical protein
VLKSRTRFPGEGNSWTFAAPAEVDLVPPVPAAFTPSGTLLDPGAAGFAASVGYLPPGAVAFAVPHVLFGLASGSLMTDRRFCAASWQSLFITTDTTAVIFRP